MLRFTQSLRFLSTHYYVFSCVLALLVLGLDLLGKVNFLKRVLDQTNAPVLQVLDQSLQKSHILYTRLFKTTQLQKDNDLLRKQQLILSHQLHSYTTLKQEHENLLSLLNRTQHLSNYRMTVLRPFEVNKGKNTSEYLISSSELSTLQAGQIAVSAQGVIGKIIHIGSKISKILCINDARSSVPVKTVHGIRGILVGQGPSRPLKLAFITKTSDIQIGETLMTSGLGGYYPKGYPIARVVAVFEHSSDPYLSIEAAPIAMLDENQYLLILKC